MFPGLFGSQICLEDKGGGAEPLSPHTTPLNIRIVVALSPKLPSASAPGAPLPDGGLFFW